MIVKLSITVYVDLGLIYLSTTSLLLFCARSVRRSLAASGAAGTLYGLAIGTSPTGCSPFSCWPVLSPRCTSGNAKRAIARTRRAGPRYAPSACIMFAAVSVAAFLPVDSRDTLWTRSPVYPLYDGLFRPAAAGPPSGATEAADAEATGAGQG